MAKIRLRILMLSLIMLACISAGVLNAGSPKERTFEKFTCDSNFFTAMIPSDWEKAEEIILGWQEKRYGVDITAPETAEGAFINISLIYFGPDHVLFKTYENYIVKNMEMPLLIIFSHFFTFCFLPMKK